ncbi:MAG: alpha/beta hydrolase-fold protein [Myxococcota bacterium]
MPRQFTVRVHYPTPEHGRIVLRTELDWDSDLEPASVSDDRTRFEFYSEGEGTYLYFKPMLLLGDRRLWSVGANYLAVHSDRDGIDIYPYFMSDSRGSISTPVELYAQALERPARIRVYQPPGYGENTLARYPVMYMHDGTNLFFPEEAFMGSEWQVDETMDQLDEMNVIDQALIVGIYAGDRIHEYTMPGYEAYGRFITGELVPWMADNYRVAGGPNNTAVMGSSLGGVVSFYLGWQYPEIFGAVGCLSSTFSWRDNLIDRVWSEDRRPIRIYLDSGWPRDNFEVTRCMRDCLLARGYQRGADLLYFAFPHAAHNERAWAKRLFLPFQFFFAKLPVQPG